MCDGREGSHWYRGESQEPITSFGFGPCGIGKCGSGDGRAVVVISESGELLPSTKRNQTKENATEERVGSNPSIRTHHKRSNTRHLPIVSARRGAASYCSVALRCVKDTETSLGNRQWREMRSDRLLSSLPGCEGHQLHAFQKRPGCWGIHRREETASVSACVRRP